MIKHRWLGLTALWAWGALSAGLQEGRAAAAYGLFQGQECMQVGDCFLTSNPSRPAYCEFWAWGFADDELKEARLNTPVGGEFALQLMAGGAMSGQDYFMAGQRAAEFPPGAYALHFTRADDSTFTVNLTQSAPASPATPKFLNLRATPLTAGTDLTLNWQPGADATAEDFTMLTVMAAGTNGWQYQTPWPGQPGALSGRATTATVPGHLLKPKDYLMVRLICYRAAYHQTTSDGVALAGSATAVMTTMQVPDQPQDSDVAQYRVLTERVFAQDGPSLPAAASPGGFEFEAAAWAQADQRLTNVTLQLPEGAKLFLPENADQILWQTNLVFEREDQLLAGTPAGAYQWTFEGVAQGRQSATSSLAVSAWPNPLTVDNWLAMQTNSFTNDVTLFWLPVVGALATDQIELAVLDAGQNVLYRAPDYAAGDSPVPGTAASLTIPANKLVDGEDYEARLRYLRVIATDTQTLTGATGVVAQCAETRFPIGTKVAAPLEITGTDLPVASVGKDYVAQLHAAGGRMAWNWSVAQGRLPAGLNLDGTGLIQGIPYETGVFNLGIQVVDSLGNQTAQSLSLSVTGTLAALAITTTNLPTLADGRFALLRLDAVGGAPPYHWALASGQLPPGLELQGDSGLLTGIAEAAGTFAFEVTLQDGAGHSKRQGLTLDVPSATNNPVLRMSQITPLSGSGSLASAGASRERAFRLHLNAQVHEVVSLEVSTNLTQWQTLLTTNLPADGDLEWTYPDQGAVFVRACRGTPEPQYNPATIRLNLDTNSLVAALLTPAGLAVSVTNTAGVVWRFEVPTNAVPNNTPISMSLVHSADGFPFEVGFLGGVSFEPEGLNLLAPATLTATFPNPLPADATGFGFGGNGEDFHLAPCEVAGNTMTFTITHFSGAMGGSANSGDTGNMVTLNMACSSLTAHEAQIANRIDRGASRAELWTFLAAWFQSAIAPNLKAAAQNDELLWFATREFLAWSILLEKYIIGGGSTDDITRAAGLRFEGRKDLAQAYANAVDRAQARCVTQFRAFQAVRMMKIAQAARTLELGGYLASEPDFFSEPKMLARYKRAFRFELQVESKFDLRANGGGRCIAQVLSSKAPIEAKDYDYSDEADLQNLTLGGSNSLLSQYWYLKSSEGRVLPVESVGQLVTVRLSIWPNYAYSGERCTKGATWNDPTEPEIACVFDAVDPVQQMKIRTQNGWQYVPLAPEGSANWYGLFKLCHATELVNENDESGAAHLRVPKIEGQENWTYRAGKLFAEATFTGPPKYGAGSGGSVNEDTKLRLFHAPLP